MKSADTLRRQRYGSVGDFSIGTIRVIPVRVLVYDFKINLNDFTISKLLKVPLYINPQLLVKLCKQGRYYHHIQQR